MFIFYSVNSPVIPTVQIAMGKIQDIKIILETLEEVTDWYSLGIHLGLKPYQLKVIEKDHQGDNNRQKLEMLILYCSLNEFDWKDVIMALTKMKRFRIAHHIAHLKGNNVDNCMFV